jgi:hypothetical protein
VCLLPSVTPISRLSDEVPPYTARTPAVSPEDGARVKFPRPRLPIWTSNMSAPPFGPGTTWVSLLLLTKTRGGLLDAAAHSARDMVTSEEEVDEVREKITGSEVVEKFPPVRVTGVSRERVSLVVVCVHAGGTRTSKNEITKAQRH